MKTRGALYFHPDGQRGDENPCAQRCLWGFECRKELRDLPAPAKRTWAWTESIPPRAPYLIRRRPAGENPRGASFSPRQSEGDENPCAQRCLWGFECRKEHRDLPTPAQPHVGMAEGNAGRSFATCLLPTRPQSSTELPQAFPQKSPGRHGAPAGAWGVAACGRAQDFFTSTHCLVFADSSTASQTYCVPRAWRKSG